MNFYGSPKDRVVRYTFEESCRRFQRPETGCDGKVGEGGAEYTTGLIRSGRYVGDYTGDRVRRLGVVSPKEGKGDTEEEEGPTIDRGGPERRVTGKELMS